MKTGDVYVEVTVVCTVAPCRKLNPFHWAVLRALQVFAPGARPGLDELAARLHLGEPAFLDEAWKDLTRWRATDDDDFAQARVSFAGEEAMRAGWFVIGAEAVRRHTLYFAKEDGRPLRAERFELKVVRDLRRPPEWSAQLTPERVEDVLAGQRLQEKVLPGERVVAVSPEWAGAQEVRVVIAKGL
jgi:hypothetical protein